jgi:hypothetical protein
MPRQTKENPLGLPSFQGQAIKTVGVEITNASGGLQDPLDIDPAMIGEVAKVTIGDTRFFLLRADCTKVRYQPVKGDEGALKYVPIFRCTDATMVDSQWAVDALQDQSDRLAQLHEEAEKAQGISHLFGRDGEPAAEEG